jgi:hypothetical protein
MGLSPSTLFHFTTKNGLKGILKENFKLNFCLELIPDAEKPIEIAVPMVSFCDIKISEIAEHIKKYGSYGIGLSKDWAFEKGLNPVNYQNLNSTFAQNLISNIRKLHKNKQLLIEERAGLVDILRYIKTYEGKLNRDGKTIENYRFADEREWRYVPNVRFQAEFKFFLNKKDYDTDEKKLEANKTLLNQRLSFNANQILYLVVKSEDEIGEIIEHIRTVKSKEYSLGEIERLMTRIISCERILKDF